MDSRPLIFFVALIGIFPFFVGSLILGLALMKRMSVHILIVVCISFLSAIGGLALIGYGLYSLWWSGSAVILVIIGLLGIPLWHSARTAGHESLSPLNEGGKS